MIHGIIPLEMLLYLPKGAEVPAGIVVVVVSNDVVVIIAVIDVYVSSMEDKKTSL